MNLVGIPYRNPEDFIKIRQQILSVYASISETPDKTVNHVDNKFNPSLYASVVGEPNNQSFFK